MRYQLSWSFCLAYGSMSFENKTHHEDIPNNFLAYANIAVVQGTLLAEMHRVGMRRITEVTEVVELPSFEEANEYFSTECIDS